MLPFLAMAQGHSSIKGTVTDASKETLPGITILLEGPFIKGTVTDPAGKFEITGMKAGTYTLKISGVGHETIHRTITLASSHESNSANREAARKAVGAVFSEQDAEIRKILDEGQFEIYAAEIKIEREGREKHHMKLIKEALALDSAQRAGFELANEAFYTTLFDNHDNYHGKPDVYKQYYKELDVSRKEAFSRLMSEDQYQTYLKLADEYKIGQSEH